MRAAAGRPSSNPYCVVPVPLSSNAVAASACSEFPPSSRSSGGFLAVPKMYVDSLVIEKRPAPDLMPSALIDTVTVTVHGAVAVGTPELVKQVPPRFGGAAG